MGQSVGVDVLTPLISFGYSLRMDSCAVPAKSELPAAHGTTSGGSRAADELRGLVRRVWWDRVLGIGADIRAKCQPILLRIARQTQFLLTICAAFQIPLVLSPGRHPDLRDAGSAGASVM